MPGAMDKQMDRCGTCMVLVPGLVCLVGGYVNPQFYFRRKCVITGPNKMRNDRQVMTIPTRGNQGSLLRKTVASAGGPVGRRTLEVG